jgi:hypothetical protein
MIRSLVRTVGYAFLVLAFALALGITFIWWYDYKTRIEQLRLVWGPSENLHARYLEEISRIGRLSDLPILLGLTGAIAVPGVVCIILAGRKKAAGAATVPPAAEGASRTAQCVCFGLVAILVGLFVFDYAAAVADPPRGAGVVAAVLQETRAVFSIPFVVGAGLAAATGAAAGAVGAALGAGSSRSGTPWRFFLFVLLCVSGAVAFALFSLVARSRS